MLMHSGDGGAYSFLDRLLFRSQDAIGYVAEVPPGYKLRRVVKRPGGGNDNAIDLSCFMDKPLIRRQLHLS